MKALCHQLNDWSAAWAEAMTTFSWQAMLLGMLVAAACLALRRQSPALRYGIWLILAAKFLVMPFWNVAVEAPDWLGKAPGIESSQPAAIAPEELAAVLPVASPARSSDIAVGVTALAPLDAPSPTPTPSTWLMLAWALVVLIGVARTVRQYCGLQRALQGARPAENDLAALVAQCARQLSMAAPEVRVTDIDGSPLVCGAFRPVLVLPASFSATAESDALRQIVLHELAHIRRGDLLTIWILHLARMLYWFHPIVHWMSYQAGLERELACDQHAMVHSGATPAGYARTLIQAAGRASQPTVLSAVGAARLDGGFTK
jgi:beta-lactamase regulating signal transducer with metallopeptidase domain